MFRKIILIFFGLSSAVEAFGDPSGQAMFFSFSATKSENSLHKFTVDQDYLFDIKARIGSTKTKVPWNLAGYYREDFVKDRLAVLLQNVPAFAKLPRIKLGYSAAYFAEVDQMGNPLVTNPTILANLSALRNRFPLPQPQSTVNLPATVSRIRMTGFFAQGSEIPGTPEDKDGNRFVASMILLTPGLGEAEDFVKYLNSPAFQKKMREDGVVERLTYQLEGASQAQRSDDRQSPADDDQNTKPQPSTSAQQQSHEDQRKAQEAAADRLDKLVESLATKVKQESASKQSNASSSNSTSTTSSVSTPANEGSRANGEVSKTNDDRVEPRTQETGRSAGRIGNEGELLSRPWQAATESVAVSISFGTITDILVERATDSAARSFAELGGDAILRAVQNRFEENGLSRVAKFITLGNLAKDAGYVSSATLGLAVDALIDLGQKSQRGEPITMGDVKVTARKSLISFVAGNGTRIVLVGLGLASPPVAVSNATLAVSSIFASAVAAYLMEKEAEKKKQSQK